MDKEQQKQQLEADLKVKNQELEALKSNTLSSIEKKTEEEKINKEIEALKIQLEEVNKQIEASKQQTDELRTSIENQVSNTEWTYELIKGTNMEGKLKEIGKSDIEVKEFAENIDAVIRKFYDKELDGFPASIKDGLCVGTQFAMMETLTADGAKGASFFESFAQTDISTGVNALGGLFKSFSGGLGGIFGKMGSGTKFFDMANRVQNFTSFLKINKNLITLSANIPELMNPYKLKQILLNPMWNDENAIYTTNVSSVLHLDSAEGVEMSIEEKAALKAIADNTNMPINEKTIAAIEKSLVTADKFLDAREKYQDSATKIMGKAASLFDIDIPLLGNAGALFGMKWPLDLIRKKKGKNKVLDFVLRIIGFPGGVEGLHAKYIKENVQLAMTDDAFVKTAYQSYQTGLTTDLVQNNEDPQSTWSKFENKFSGLKEEQKIDLKSKLPPQYDLIKKSIVESLDENSKINPNVVKQFAPEIITVVDGKQVVDVSKILDKAGFADKYLQFIVPKLVNSGEDFIASAEVNSNTFVLAIFGNLIADKFFVEGVNIGIINVGDYQIINSEQPITNNIVEEEAHEEQLKINITTELEKYHSPVTADMVINTSKKFSVPVEYIMAFMRNDSHYGTEGVAIETHNPGNVGNTDDGSINDLRTWEAGVDAVGQNLQTRIATYKEIFGENTFPTIKELATGKNSVGTKFYGVYMTKDTGPDSVLNIHDQLVASGVVSKEMKE